MTDKKIAPILKVLERLPVSAVIASPITGRVLWTNAQNIELAGATHPDQLIGRSIVDFIDASQHAIALRDLAAVALGQSPPPVVYHLKRLDGGVADGQISSVPLIYDGQPAMLSLITEVTEREQLLRELRDSEERYRLLVESLPVGLSVVVDDEIVFVNPATAGLLGYDAPGDLIGRTLYGLLTPESGREVRKVRRQALLTRAPIGPMRVTAVTASGETVELSASSTVVNWLGARATQTIMRPLDECAED